MHLTSPFYVTKIASLPSPHFFSEIRPGTRISAHFRKRALKQWWVCMLKDLHKQKKTAAVCPWIYLFFLKTAVKTDYNQIRFILRDTLCIAKETKVLI